MIEQLNLFDRVNQETDRDISRLRIPGRTESPTKSAAMLRCWIEEFCEYNNKHKPKGLRKKNYTQLIGLYRGMLESYDINEFRDILPEKHY